MFKDLSQFKAYLAKIKNFNELLIIQQGGRGIDATAMIKSIEKAIVNDYTSVFNKNENLWKSIGITSEDILKELAKNNKFDKFEQLKNVFKTTR